MAPPVVMNERLAVVEPAIEPVIEPVVEPVIEPAMEPVAELVIEAQVGPETPPAAAAMEPEPPAVAEATPAALPEVTYGSSGVVEEVARADLPDFMKRKRGKRMAAVRLKSKTDLAALHAKPDTQSPVTAQLQSGVLGSIKNCNGTWCRLAGDGFDGWIEQNRLWGVYQDEKVE